MKDTEAVSTIVDNTVSANMYFNQLAGRRIYGVVEDSTEILMLLDNFEVFRLYHEQDCCENVFVDDIEGDWEDIIGQPILKAEEKSHNTEDDEYDMSGTWTFYKLVTAAGYIDIRWLGTSNGYYSEHVDSDKRILQGDALKEGTLLPFFNNDKENLTWYVLQFTT